MKNGHEPAPTAGGAGGSKREATEASVAATTAGLAAPAAQGSGAQGADARGSDAQRSGARGSGSTASGFGEAAEPAARADAPRPASGFNSIRMRLLALVVVCLVPAWALAGAMIYRFADGQRVILDVNTRDTASDLAAAIEREIVGLQASLSALATSPFVEDGRYDGFRRQALALRGTINTEITLIERDGQIVMTTRAEPGAPLPRAGNPDWVRRVVGTGRPQVTDVYLGPATRESIVAVMVPVRRASGEIAYVLQAAVMAERFGAAVLDNLSVLPGGLLALRDGAGALISQRRDPSAGPPVRAAGAPSAADAEALDASGAPLHVVSAPVSGTSWVATVSVPNSTIDAPLRRALLPVVAGGLGLAVLGIAAAFVAARSVSRPVAALSGLAHAVSRDLNAPRLSTGLVEADRIGDALVTAARERAAFERARRDSEARLAQSYAEIETVFAVSAVGLALVDREGRLRQVNEAMAAVLGRTTAELVGRTPQEASPAFGDAVDRPLREALTGRNLRDVEVKLPGSAALADAPVRPDPRAGGPPARTWLASFEAVRDEGAVIGVAVSLLDITERERAEARQSLLIHELNHRVKNTLATIQSLAAQTFRTSVDKAGREAFEARLIALSRAHDILTRETWEGADLREVAREVLAAHRGGALDADRFEVEGPSVRVTPRTALSLSMALHELATNAAKYGALSAEGGRVSLRWRVEEAGAPRLRLEWVESGGPPVAPPTRRGFGSRLVERALAAELGGDVRLHFEPAGLRCTIDVPLAPAPLALAPLAPAPGGAS